MSVAGVLVAVALMASADGRIAELTAEIGRFRSECAAANRPLGIPDENGAFVLTADGRRLEKLEAELHRLRGETGLASAAALAQGWGDKPLGAPGTLKAPPKTFRRAARLGKAPVRKPGLVLFGPDVLRRLGLFRTTLEYAQWQKRTLFFKGDQKAGAALKGDFLDFVQATSATPDGVVSVCPVRIGYYNTFLR